MGIFFSPTLPLHTDFTLAQSKPSQESTSTTKPSWGWMKETDSRLDQVIDSNVNASFKHQNREYRIAYHLDRLAKAKVKASYHEVMLRLEEAKGKPLADNPTIDDLTSKDPNLISLFTRMGVSPPEDDDWSDTGMATPVSSVKQESQTPTTRAKRNLRSTRDPRNLSGD